MVRFDSHSLHLDVSGGYREGWGMVKTGFCRYRLAARISKQHAFKIGRGSLTALIGGCGEACLGCGFGGVGDWRGAGAGSDGG